MNKLWQDFHTKKTIYGLVVLTTFVFFLYISFDELLNPSLKLDYISIVIILLFFLLFFIHFFRLKLSYLSTEGIRIGNTPNSSNESIRLENKPFFIKWGEISNLKIYGKNVSTALSSGVDDILQIKTDKKKYESFIAQPQGFVKALKRLNKQNLLTKDSKYREFLK